jgi:hypothetical protein
MLQAHRITAIKLSHSLYGLRSQSTGFIRWPVRIAYVYLSNTWFTCTRSVAERKLKPCRLTKLSIRLWVIPGAVKCPQHTRTGAVQHQCGALQTDHCFQTQGSGSSDIAVMSATYRRSLYAMMDVWLFQRPSETNNKLISLHCVCTQRLLACFRVYIQLKAWSVSKTC